MKQNIRLLLILTVFFTWQAGANVVGSDIQSFNPTSDGLDFVTVQSGRSLPPGYFTLGTFLDYAVNTLPNAVGSNGVKFSIPDRVFSSDVHAAVGLYKNWEIGASLSSLISGTVNNANVGSYFEQHGITDARVETKYRFLTTANGGLALVLTCNFPQVSNDPFLGGKNSPIADAEMAYSVGTTRWLWAFNGGYRFRDDGAFDPNSIYDPVPSEITASTALAYRPLQSKWTTIGEVYSAQPTANTPRYTADQLTNIEALLGTKYRPQENLNFQAGVTAGISRGVNTPDYRIYVGANWYPRMWGGKSADVAQAKPAPAPPPAPKPAPAPIPPPVQASKASDLSVFNHEPVAPVERFSVRDINFETAKADIPSSFHPYLKALTEYAKKGKPLKRMKISGYTDSRGGAVYNQDLSLRRAQAVMQALSEQYGIDPAKMEAVGYGPANPVDTNATAVGRSRNRRVEFEIERGD